MFLTVSNVMNQKNYRQCFDSIWTNSMNHFVLFDFSSSNESIRSKMNQNDVMSNNEGKFYNFIWFFLVW